MRQGRVIGDCLMAMFKFTVIETRTVECEYTVEAETEAAAREMAEIGDTADEVVFAHTIEVVEREIV